MPNDERPRTESFVDSSYSRTYLTTSNNPFLQVLSTTDNPVVLAERRRRNALLATKRSRARTNIAPLLLTSIPTCSILNAQGVKYFRRDTSSQGAPRLDDMTEILSEEQINALPLSSDEEDLHEDKGKATPPPKKTTTLKRPAPSEKPSDSRRSKRYKKDEGPTVKSKGNQENTKAEPAKDDMLDFLSQTSQTRKSKGYAGSSQRSFTTPSFDPDTPQQSKKHKNIQILTSSPMAPSTIQALRFSPPPASSGETTVPSLVIHRETDEGDEEEPEPSMNSTTFSNKRRGSSSSLSSVDSLPDYQLDAVAKKRLMNENSESNLAAALSPGQFRCAICGRTSTLAGLHLPFLPRQKSPKQRLPSADLIKLPISKQQALCRAHRIRDAQLSWTRHDYPTINTETWTAFPSRISKHIPHLISVLNRKIPSYYLKHLDDALTSARGNQKAINIFFNVTTLTLIRHGFYGPKGSKLVAQILLNDKALQKVLNRQMKSDKNMRTAGVGRLVDNVLVPEVLMRIVGEDMGVQDEEARKILDESSEAGVLLWGDDDEVEDDNE